MTIYYVVNARIPTEKAHGIQIMKTCEALAAAGTEIELVLPARENALTDDPFSYYGVRRTFRLVKLPCFDGVRFGPLGYVLGTVAFLHAARRHVAHAPPALVYTREPLAPWVIRGAVLELHTRPGWLARRALRSARRIIAITHGLRQTLIRDGVPGYHIAVVPDGVDVRQFALPLSRAEARQAVGLPEDIRVALYAGSVALYAWKGIDTVVAAAREAPDMLFVCVGGVQEEFPGDAPANVRFLGHVPHERVPLYLRAADVLLLPNRAGDPASERYTSPLKLFEYMASGIPIVASDLPSMREVLSEATATLVRPNDPVALAEGIRTTMVEEAEALERARRARAEVERFSWDARAKRILAFIGEAASHA